MARVNVLTETLEGQCHALGVTPGLRASGQDPKARELLLLAGRDSVGLCVRSHGGI